MNSTAKDKWTVKLEQMMVRVPRWMSLDRSRIDNLADLEFQIGHEIDLIEEGDCHASKCTKPQLYRAKMLASEVHIQAAMFAQENPELVDSCNHVAEVCPTCGQEVR